MLFKAADEFLKLKALELKQKRIGIKSFVYIEEHKAQLIPLWGLSCLHYISQVKFVSAFLMLHSTVLAACTA